MSSEPAPIAVIAVGRLPPNSPGAPARSKANAREKSPAGIGPTRFDEAKLNLSPSTNHLMISTKSPLSSTEDAKLDGEVETDELYTHAGMKGRNYHELIIKHRIPRRRAIKPWKGRGTFNKDHPMVMCYHQRNGRTVFDVPINYDSIASLVCKTIGYGSTVYTDDYAAYLALKEHGFKHQSVSHSSKEYARDDVHVNDCE
jgi:hypothetical protein